MAPATARTTRRTRGPAWPITLYVPRLGLEGGADGAGQKLWSYAQPADRALRAVGFVAAIGAGAALPIMTLVFGQLINVFNSWSLGTISKAEFERQLGQNALYFVYLFAGKFACVYTHTTVFTISATRMTGGLRLAYVRAILRQEIAYFDTCTPGSVATRISTNANLIQTGLGEKVGIATQGLAMLGSAFVVAFTQQWKLTLVTATTLPAGRRPIPLPSHSIPSHSIPPHSPPPHSPPPHSPSVLWCCCC